MPKKFSIPLLILLCLFLNVARAAAFDWDPVSDQEKQLKDNPLDPGSGALVIFKRGEIDVQPANASLWTTRIKTYTRIKILNDSGRNFGNVVLDMPKFVRLSKIEGRTILPSGEIIPLDTSKVFRGVAFTDGKDFAVLTTSFAFSSVQPGAILEYQIEEYADWFYAPPWIFDTQGMGTLQSSLKTIVSNDMEMDEKPVGFSAGRIVGSQKETSTGLETDWLVHFLNPINQEPYSVPFRDRALIVLLTPVRMLFAGRPTPLITSWNDVTRVLNGALNEMDKTKTETASKAHELADKAKDPRDRAAAIYKYLQDNVRSSGVVGVNITRTADEVISGKRGDPDNINAVFATMLREVKVDADLVLLATSNWETLTESFPNTCQFSRMIVRVNLKNGAVFADAAIPGAPFGELPWFERGVNGMVIQGNKMIEVMIPYGAPEDNLSLWNYGMKIGSNLEVEGDEQMELKGVRAIDYRGNAIGENSDQLQQRLTKEFGLGHADSLVSDISHSDFRDTTQALALKAHIKYSVADESGPGEVLMNPWMEDVFRSSPFKSVDRKSYIHFQAPEKRVTTSSWTFAPDVRVEKLPAAVSLQSDLADFSHACTESGATITCTRTFIVKKTMMMGDPSSYTSVKRFFDEVTQHDQEVILLQKK
jgi:hypothetical protein